MPGMQHAKRKTKSSCGASPDLLVKLRGSGAVDLVKLPQTGGRL